MSSLSSMFHSAKNGLKHQLEADKIDQDEYNRELDNLEGRLEDAADAEREGRKDDEASGRYDYE